MQQYKLFNTSLYNEWSLYYFHKIIKYNNIDNNLLSRNKNINENTVLLNLDYNWNINCLYENPSISHTFLEKNFTNRLININSKVKNITYTINDAILENNNINVFSLNKNIVWNDILENPSFNWDFDYLSENTNIKIENIIENKDLDWSYFRIMSNPIFNISDLDKIPKLKKFRTEYFLNPNFDLYEYMNFFGKNNIEEIDYLIHFNKEFNIKIYNDIISEFPEYNFDYAYLLDKKNLDIDFLLLFYENKDLDNNAMYYLSQNPNLTFDFIDNNKYNWNFKYMSKNDFDRQREIFLTNAL